MHSPLLIFRFCSFFLVAPSEDLCLECLPPLVFSLGRAERVKFDNFYEALQKFDGVSPEIKANRDVAKWAFNVVSTRSFGDANEKQIAPVADMVRSALFSDSLHFKSFFFCALIC